MIENTKTTFCLNLGCNRSLLYEGYWAVNMTANTFGVSVCTVTSH